MWQAGGRTAEATSQLSSQAQDFGYEVKDPKQATTRFPVPELNNEALLQTPGVTVRLCWRGGLRHSPQKVGRYLEAAVEGIY